MEKHTLKGLLSTEKPLIVPGAINAYCAMLARDAGFKALYLSGAGVANASYGLPDLGFTELVDVLIDAKRIVDAVDLPLIVDCDTGFGRIKETVCKMEEIGVAAIHLEDQHDRKRCGHRPGKFLISQHEMEDRLHQAFSVRVSDDFLIIARCDALANEGIDGVIKRCKAYIKVGADMIFVDAVRSLAQYQILAETLSVPVIANITEFGATPMLTQNELKQAGVGMVLYPLTAFRMMSQAALTTYQTLQQEGSQLSLLDKMQTRESLYEHLDYHRFEAEQNASQKD